MHRDAYSFGVDSVGDCWSAKRKWPPCVAGQDWICPYVEAGAADVSTVASPPERVPPGTKRQMSDVSRIRRE
jgi:hypothetical protein